MGSAYGLETRAKRANSQLGSIGDRLRASQNCLLMCCLTFAIGNRSSALRTSAEPIVDPSKGQLAFSTSPEGATRDQGTLNCGISCDIPI